MVEDGLIIDIEVGASGFTCPLGRVFPSPLEGLPPPPLSGVPPPPPPPPQEDRFRAKTISDINVLIFTASLSDTTYFFLSNLFYTEKPDREFVISVS